MEIRHPPRFVPTLTDVVAEPDILQSEGLSPSAALSKAVSLPDLPVLQDVLPGVVSSDAESNIHQVLPEVKLDRVKLVSSLQSKIELQVQEQLKAGLTDLVMQHAQKLCLDLQSDLERLVAQAIQEALEKELRCLETASLEPKD